MRCKIVIGLVVSLLSSGVYADDANRNAILFEALSRLPANQVTQHPELQTALNHVLDGVKGSQDFVDLVERFKVTSRNPDLLELAVSKPDDQLGVEALRALYRNQGMDLVKTTLSQTNSPRSGHLAEAIGNVGGKNAETLLLPLLNDTKRDAAFRRQALMGLVKTKPGAEAVIKLAKNDQLPTDLRLTATTALNQSGLPGVQTAAAEVLPPPLSGNAQPLPPVSQLLAMKGDAKRGETVFFRPLSNCSNCHAINGKGKDFGPALSEIGTKLGKDALFEAILEPSAGISFGYEAWEVKLKNGDEADGLMTSETGDSITIKDATGLNRQLAKSAIASRKQLKTSIMPVGLQMTMTTQELVDLVEFLSQRKKKP